MYTQQEKLSICYTCCGPTYRKTAYEKLQNYYFDNDNLHYFILTDQKDYFKGINRKNLVVNELKDFYKEYPELEQYESFLESDSKEDYAKKFVEINYKFPFSTMRFHLEQSRLAGICNVSMIGTDSHFDFDHLNSLDLSIKNTLYNALTQWDDKIEGYDPNYSQMIHHHRGVNEVVRLLKENYGLDVDNTFRVFDAAARLYVFENLDKLEQFFTIWNEIVLDLHRTRMIQNFLGSYAINDEYILGPICNALKIVPPKVIDNHVRLFTVNHNPIEERFWA
jgi:hypothetical protein